MEQENNKPAGEMDAKPLTFDEILSDKEYQSEFDKRVSKALETAKGKWENDYQSKQNEAQKLAKMKDDEKLQYEKEKVEKELNDLKSQLNAKNLKDEAYKIASEKQIPISYLDLIDFTKETAESINGKITNIAEARTKDLETYLNTKLKEPAPKQVSGSTAQDPFLKGFEEGFKK